MVSVTGSSANDPKNLVRAGQSYGDGVIFDGVGKVLINLKTVGTATLIDKQFLITAKHIFPGDYPNDQPSSGIIKFTISNGAGGEIEKEVQFLAENIRFAPDADLAIIKLDSPVPINIDSYELYSGAPGSELGKTFVHVGYGRSATGANGVVGLPGTKRWGTNTYDEEAVTDSGKVLKSDFDSGSVLHNRLAGTKEGTGLMEVTGTQGDSGGPNFINKQLAGITSGGMVVNEGAFGSIEEDVQISRNLPWIKATIEALTEKNSLKTYVSKLETYMDSDEWTTDVTQVAAALVAPQSSVDVQSGLKINSATIRLDGAVADLGVGYEGGQHGIFEAVDFGDGRRLDHGVVLTTGGMPKFFAGNGLGNADLVPTSMEGDGDADLDKLIPGFTTHDASTLSFTFTNSTSHNAVTFRVIFGSDEWGEGANGAPDIAGIFVNGKNYAVFSDGTLLKVMQPSPNRESLFGPAENIEYDGVTKTLLVTAEVWPGENTVKIAVADAHANSGNTGSGDTGLFVSDMRLITMTPGVQPGMMNIVMGPNGTVHDDMITGDDVGNTLNGGAGADWLIGMNGNDTFADFLGNNFFDGGDGFDTIDYSQSTTGVRVDLDINKTENYAPYAYPAPTTTAKDNFSSIEAVVGSSAPDVIYGNQFSNVLKGGGGVDFLDGRGGADTLVGGVGSDVYYVDTTSDVIVENTNEGNDDYVYSTVSWALADNFEHLSLQGTTGLTGIGNASNNKINGTLGNDMLAGLGGADKISGSGGNDTVTYDQSPTGVTVSLATNKNFGGHAEGDFLAAIENVTGSQYDDVIEGYTNNDATFGNNSLKGGFGIDTVSYANASGKVKVSLAVYTAQVTGGAGTDTLSGFENVTGSAFNDNLTGSAGANVLDGLAGADRMAGGAGSDTYVVDNIGDIVVEASGQGSDLVRSSLVSYTLGSYVENLELVGSAVTGIGSSYGNKITGNSVANTLKGMAGADTIFGGDGNDVIDGGSGDDWIAGNGGADRIYGGLNNDTFVFSAIADSTAGSDGRFNANTSDIIDRFVRGEDKIDLSAIDANGALTDDMAFHFGWDGNPGALTVVSVAGNVGGAPGYENYVFADVNGDRLSDMVFAVLSFDKLTMSDFLL